ncbi:MAG: hypothetical protein AAFV88_06145 [Planctomycetota bacterium]
MDRPKGLERDVLDRKRVYLALEGDQATRNRTPRREKRTLAGSICEEQHQPTHTASDSEQAAEL